MLREIEVTADLSTFRTDGEEIPRDKKGNRGIKQRIPVIIIASFSGTYLAIIKTSGSNSFRGNKNGDKS